MPTPHYIDQVFEKSNIMKTLSYFWDFRKTGQQFI